MKRPGISWALHRDLRETVTADEDHVILHAPQVTGTLFLFTGELDYEIVMSRSAARLLAKRLNQCLDGTTRSAMRARARDRQ